MSFTSHSRKISVKMRYVLFGLMKEIFPKDLYDFIGSSYLLKYFRNIFFRKKNLPIIHSLKIKWRTYDFFFQAPFQVLYRAETKGIESSLLTCILKLINPKDEIIDIGANYGFISLISGFYVKESCGKIYSFESEKFIYENLKETIEKNNLVETIETYHAFVWSNDKGNRITIDTLLNGRLSNLSLIKIDTDGSDFECLRGCENIIDKFKPFIIIELNQNGDIIIKWLKDNGYKYFYDQYFNIIKNDSFPPNLIASTNVVSI